MEERYVVVNVKHEQARLLEEALHSKRSAQTMRRMIE